MLNRRNTLSTAPDLPTAQLSVLMVSRDSHSQVEGRFVKVQDQEIVHVDNGEHNFLAVDSEVLAWVHFGLL